MESHLCTSVIEVHELGCARGCERVRVWFIEPSYGLGSEPGFRGGARAGLFFILMISLAALRARPCFY